jgi:fumarate hydratase, class I
MNYNSLKTSIYNLISETSSNLPPDVRRALSQAMDTEIPETQSALALNTIATNVDMALENVAPICQDTGMPTFYIHTPAGVDQLEIKNAIEEAIVQATKDGKLRPNSVDSITGKNSGNNLGPGTPVIHFEQWTHQDEIEIKLLLKGAVARTRTSSIPSPPNFPISVKREERWTGYVNVSSMPSGRRRDTVAVSG